MVECPCCLGEGRFPDSAEFDAVLERLNRAAGRYYVPQDPTCDVCEGTGYVTPEETRDFSAYMVARTDQFLAAVNAGEITL